MTAARSKGQAPIALTWMRRLRDADLAEAPMKPQTILLVGWALVTWADADGSKCHPTQVTIAQALGMRRATVRAVLGWLVDTGWLRATGKGQWGQTAYRLTLPAGADEHADVSRGVGLQEPTPSSSEGPGGGLLGGLPGGPPGAHNLLPPNVREEDESASAPVADAPVAALSSNGDGGSTPSMAVVERSQLFVVERVPAQSEAPSEAAPIDGALDDELHDIAMRAGVSIDSKIVGPALVAAAVRTGWPLGVVTVYSIELLRRLGSTARVPSRLLATDLGGIDSTMAMSPRMVLAHALARLDDIGNAWRPFDDGLVVADLWVYESDETPRPGVWDFKPAKLEQVSLLALEALDAANRRRAR